MPPGLGCIRYYNNLPDQALLYRLYFIYLFIMFMARLLMPSFMIIDQGFFMADLGFYDIIGLDQD